MEPGRIVLSVRRRDAEATEQRLDHRLQIVRIERILPPGPVLREAPASHQDQIVKLPTDARVLGGNEFTPYGIIEYPQRRAMSLQSHPEFSPEYAAALIELRRNSKYTAEQADRALATLREPNDRARVGGWLAQFLRSNVRP